ncbi:MAG: glycine hydroxymethyltransferase [Clostridiales bacterium]|jgi:glycine hydroxymethyltransferase|nr:glycine hydroxymethyltransferase [Clostridiales bacterium]
MNILRDYLEATQGRRLNAQMLTFVANMDGVARGNPEIARSIVKELADQRSHLKLIASENFSSLNVQAALGNLMTDKYAEGSVGNRYYAGCENVDEIEDIARKEAMALFGAEHAYVQPHSGSDANTVAFWAILRQRVQVPALEATGYDNITKLPKEKWDEIRQKMGNQKLLGMDLLSGGHLTHGYRHNVSAQMFDCYSYHVDKETGLIDYEVIRKMLHEIKPLVFLVGFSAYTRNIDYELCRKMADEVGAVLMVDMAHFAGLVAGGALKGVNNPVPYAHICTTTTHKTLRGPRGGMVLCKAEFADFVDRGCPHVLGGPLPHVMAAKALAFKEAQSPEFKAYAQNVIDNARALAAGLEAAGIATQTGGTDNHIVLVNVANLGLTGRQAETALRECGFTLNRNALPYDALGPWYTSGLRLGTPALTSLGMGIVEMEQIAAILARVLKSVKPATTKSGAPSKAKYILDENVKSLARKEIQLLLHEFVLYPEIDLEFFDGYFNW